jgi:sugar lactone lactonase YvrE
MTRFAVPVFAMAALVGLGPATLAGPLPRQELQRRYERALAAHRSGDYRTFLAESEAAAALAPQSLHAAYNVACGHALLGHDEDALAILERFARMEVSFDLKADEDFTTIRRTARFRAVVDRMAALESPIGASRIAFTVPGKDLLVEGVAYDPKTKAFFVSSIHRRKIVRAGPGGDATDFVAEARDGLLSPMALAVDPATRSLWASTDGLPEARDLPEEERGRSSVVEFDVDTGKTRRVIEAPPSCPGARFSDLTLGPGGDLFVADPWSGRIYVLRKGEAAFRVLVDTGPLFSPQGMAFSAEGRWLFVADYTQGVVRVDPGTGASRVLDAPPDAAVAGVDGLVWLGGGLVGIQNGVNPNRLIRLRLDARDERIESVSVLERKNPSFDEPTLGVVVGDDLYYVANSQHGAFGESGQPDTERLVDTVILKLRITP